MKKFLIALTLAASFSAYSEPACISHQGSFKHAAPNSLQALMAAIRLNADGLEFDLRHTLDGVPILMQDKQLASATHAEGMSCPLQTRISQLYFKVIRENCILKGKYPVRIPSLEEALHLVTGTRKLVVVELKDEPTRVTEEILHYYFQDYPKNLRILSLKSKYLDRLRTINPDNSWFWKEVDGSKNVWPVNKAIGIKLFLKLGIKTIITDEIELCQQLKTELSQP